jgi:hypothetical protein
VTFPYSSRSSPTATSRSSPRSSTACVRPAPLAFCQLPDVVQTSDYLKDDSVFAVKDDLVLDFVDIKQSKSGWKPPKEYADKMQYERASSLRLLRVARMLI